MRRAGDSSDGGRGDGAGPPGLGGKGWRLASQAIPTVSPGTCARRPPPCHVHPWGGTAHRNTPTPPGQTLTLPRADARSPPGRHPLSPGHTPAPRQAHTHHEGCTRVSYPLPATGCWLPGCCPAVPNLGPVLSVRAEAGTGWGIGGGCSHHGHLPHQMSQAPNRTPGSSPAMVPRIPAALAAAGVCAG